MRLDDQEVDLGAVWIRIFVPRNSHAELLAVCRRKSSGAESEERRDVCFACARERQTDRQTDRVNVKLKAAAESRQGVAIETPCACTGSQQHSPFLQPVGTRIFWGYFRSVLACICPGRAHAQLPRACGKYTSAMSTEIPAHLMVLLKGRYTGRMGGIPGLFLKGSRAGREGRSQLTVTQKCLFPSGSRTAAWKNVQAEDLCLGGHRVAHGCSLWV